MKLSCRKVLYLYTIVIVYVSLTVWLKLSCTNVVSLSMMIVNKFILCPSLHPTQLPFPYIAMFDNPLKLFLS